MPDVIGGNAGYLAPIIQAIVPIGQFPLSSTVLGSNNFISGQTANRHLAAQPRDVVLAYITAQVFGAVPTAGTTTITVTNSSPAISWTATGASLTVSTANTAAIYKIFADQFNKVLKGTSISLTATSSGWTQSSGGLIVTLWAWGTNT